MDATPEHRDEQTTAYPCGPTDMQVTDLLDLLSEAFAIVDAHWRITYMNRMAEALWGQPRDALVGVNLWEVLPHAVDTPACHQLLGAMRERRLVAFDYCISHLDRWFEVRAYPCGAGLAISVHDSTGHNQAEAALHASEERYRTLVEQMSEGLLQVDTHDVIQFVNDRYCEMTGYPRTELIGKPAAQLLLLSDADRRIAQEQNRRRTQGAAERYEIRLRKQSGQVIWVEVGGTLVVDAAGAIIGSIGVVTDITTRKQAEAALRRAHDALETRVAERTCELAAANAALRQENTEHRRTEHARQQLLKQLVSAQEEERGRIARELHDSLGQYLTALRVGLEGVQAQDSCSPHMADNLQRLCDLALTLDVAVDRLAFELRPAALDDLGLEQALDMLAREWTATSHIPVDLHTSGFDQRRLPATLETTVYRTVQEALTNVLKHARATHVSLVVEQRPTEVLAIIEDDGQGFNLHTVTQTPGAPRRFGLTGMHERVLLAGGQLDIETAPGAGTVVYLHIPLPPDARDEGATSAHD
ncbi:MAG: PAS domain S-box protein [Roseiflexaceae bacterium]